MASSIRNLLFLGKASEQKLLNQGIRTIGDLARERHPMCSTGLGKKRDISYGNIPRGIDDSL